MKKSYFKYNLTGGGGIFTLSLMALLLVIGASEPASGGVPVKALDGLKIQLTRPNVSGAEVLGTDETKSCHYSYDDNELSILLGGLENGTHRLTVKCEYGTNTYVLAVIDCVVSVDGTQGEAIEIELPVVKTIGDAAAGLVIDPTPTENSENPVASGGVYTALAGKQPAGSYADGSIYKVGESGEEGSEVENVAKVQGHSVELSSDAQATGLHAVAEGGSADGDKTKASGNYSHAEGLRTIASGVCSHAGGIGDYGGKVEASGQASIAFGVAQDDDGRLTAGGDGAIAVGHAGGYSMFANGDGSQAFGIATQTQTRGQMVLGMNNVLDTNGDYALIVGNGTADNTRSNAFAIDWNGNLVLFNAGTPVVLTPAKLATLIA